MLEKDVEKYLVKRVAELGGIAEKMQSLTGRGFFDRLVVLPGGLVAFVEVKRPSGARWPPHQRNRFTRYVGLGCRCYVVRTAEGVDEMLRSLTGHVS